MRVAEPGSVITDLCQCSGRARFAEPRKADENRIVRVLLERLNDGRSGECARRRDDPTRRDDIEEPFGSPSRRDIAG